MLRQPPLSQPSPEFLTPTPTVRAAVGPDDSITGKLNFVAPTRIDGTLRGEVRSSDLLVVGETGVVDGTIRATRLVILGRVHGDVLGAERIEIGPRGSLHGMVDAADLVVREGGVLHGPCRVAPAEKARIHPLRPRTASAAGSNAPPATDGRLPQAR